MHLLAQWVHLLGLSLWFGVVVAAGVFQILALETLLFAGWAVLLVQGVTGLLTLWQRAAARRGDLAKGAATRWLQAANLAMGLAIAWVMIMLLLVHEGVDHAL